MRFRARLAVSPICEASSKRQGDGQRFQKKAMKTTNQNEASAPANVRPSSVSKTSKAMQAEFSAGKQPEFVRHCVNRRLSTEMVLNYFGRGCRGNMNWPRSSANGFGWTFRPLASPVWPVCFGLWASTGISGAASGSIRAAVSTRSASIPPTRAQSIAPIFPPTFSPLEAAKVQRLHHYLWITVSETVSESGERVVKNCGELKRILIESPIKSAIIQ